MSNLPKLSICSKKLTNTKYLFCRRITDRMLAFEKVGVAAFICDKNDMSVDLQCYRSDCDMLKFQEDFMYKSRKNPDRTKGCKYIGFSRFSCKTAIDNKFELYSDPVAGNSYHCLCCFLEDESLIYEYAENLKNASTFISKKTVFYSRVRCV